MNDNRALIPDTLRQKVLAQFHDSHPGINGMKSLVRSLLWYPGIDKEVSLW